VVGQIATLKKKAAFLDPARSGRGYRHFTNFTSVAQPGGTLDAVGGPRFTCRRAGSRGRSGIGAIVAGSAHHLPVCLAGFTSR